MTRAFLFSSVFAIPLAAQSTPQSAPQSACSAVSLGDYGALNGWVPSPGDAWHQDISSTPVDPMSSAIINTSGDLAGAYLHADFTIPYTVVDSTQAPMVPITAQVESDDTLYPLTPTTLLEGNPGQCWNDNADHHAIMIDKSKCVDYEVYQANLCGGSWTSYADTVWDLTIPGGEKRPYGMTSVDAAGLSLFEGLVRYDEIVAGAINHAIRFTAMHTKDDNANGYFTAPATHAAGSLWGTDNIMGMRIRLKPDFDMSSYSPTNQIILRAMQKYGMILADNGSNMFFQGTPDPRWNGDDLSNLKNVPSSAFEVVQMAPVYDSNTAPTGPSPTINSFTASETNITPGQSVTLTPSVDGGSYEYVDVAGFTRGPITVSPTQTTTYTLSSRNQYGSASATTTVTVGGQQASTALAIAAIPATAYGAGPVALSSSSNSTGAILYSVVSGPATIAGNVLTVLGAGTVTVKASQAASSGYPATATTASFTVNAASPVLAFTGPSATKVMMGDTMTLGASSNSSGAITYSVVSGPGVITGNTVSFTGSGLVVVQATQAATVNFASATTVKAFISVR